MNKLDFSVKIVAWESARQDIKPIREAVFIQEQHVPVELEWDGLDKDSIHVLATLEDSKPAGTARLLSSGHIGRMAVLREYRKLGIGSAVLSALLEYAKEHQINDLFLLAQTQAVSFYEQYGFSAIGEIFMDAGIPHKKMIYSQAGADTIRKTNTGELDTGNSNVRT